MMLTMMKQWLQKKEEEECLSVPGGTYTDSVGLVNLAICTAENECSAVTVQVVTMSTVGAPIIPTQSLSKYNKEYIEGDNSFDNSFLSTGSVSSEEGIEDQHLEKLPLYLAGKVMKDKNNFCINNEEEEAAIDDSWIPHDWNPSDLKEKQPPFQDVDKPGNWPVEFCYRPTFNKKEEYEGHKLPTCAKPVLLDDKGKQTHDGWESQYNGWGDEESARD
eukprot:15365748-Ditylum_brightwellii.AAC.1